MWWGEITCATLLHLQFFRGHFAVGADDFSFTCRAELCTFILFRMKYYFLKATTPKSDNWTLQLAFDWNCFTMANVNSTQQGTINSNMCCAVCIWFQWNAPHEYHFYLWIWVSQVINFTSIVWYTQCTYEIIMCARKTSHFTAPNAVGFGAA